jgi:hypothetical protein
MNMIAEQRQRKAGRRNGSDVLSCDKAPMAKYCTERQHPMTTSSLPTIEKSMLSDIAMSTIVQSDTLAKLDGVLVASIWYTSRNRIADCTMLENVVTIPCQKLPCAPDNRLTRYRVVPEGIDLYPRTTLNT